MPIALTCPLLLIATPFPLAPELAVALPVKFTPDASVPIVISGAWIEVDTQSGKALKIERVMIIDNDLQVGSEDD